MVPRERITVAYVIHCIDLTYLDIEIPTLKNSEHYIDNSLDDISQWFHDQLGCMKYSRRNIKRILVVEVNSLTQHKWPTTTCQVAPGRGVGRTLRGNVLLDVLFFERRGGGIDRLLLHPLAFRRFDGRFGV